MIRKVWAIALLLIAAFACQKDRPVGPFQTKHVIIVVIDGPRYSETWMRPENIPVKVGLLSQGVLADNFQNNGITVTVCGHSAICTGNYENLKNNGTQKSDYPSIFQCFLGNRQVPGTKAWVVASKDKLWMLGNTIHPYFKDKFLPSIDCGVNRDGTGGYRADTTTIRYALEHLASDKPDLMLINLKDPDWFGHANDSLNYIKAIQNSDQMIGQLWDFIQSDSYFKNSTTLIVTNDHGRHLDGHLDGFVSHGDGCLGCRHIEFFALSPDFKQNAVVSTAYSQIDISATVAYLMGFPMRYSKGKVMWDLFR